MYPLLKYVSEYISNWLLVFRPDVEDVVKALSTYTEPSVGQSDVPNELILVVNNCAPVGFVADTKFVLTVGFVAYLISEAVCEPNRNFLPFQATHCVAPVVILDHDVPPFIE